ncbi:MAG: type II toxin-antitoxin system VapC family toxin [Cytophagales bacterium]|nr:type II toxin-antitoxin system VapC family toxin [Cytophagales bacterium]
MALVLHIEKRKISSKVKKVFTEAENGRCEIIIPAMVLVEISYLYEGKKIKTSLKDVEKHLKKYSYFKEHPLDKKVIATAFEIKDIKELHDRLIAGTAKILNTKLITNDPVIIASKYVKTIW